MKECKSCKILQPLTNYHKCNKSADKLQYLCKLCQHLYRINKLYNCDSDKYHNLLKFQNYSCAICQVLESKLNYFLHLDHCHQTNKIRGLLCNDCNIGLGQFNDNINHMKSAINYINLDLNYVVDNKLIKKSKIGGKRAIILNNNKKCSYCLTFQSLEQFSKRSKSIDGFNSICKLCNNDFKFFYKWGITRHGYNEILIKQNYKCAICNIDNNLNLNFYLDHNHKNNHYRGILCTNCNFGIGAFKDDINIINNAIIYLNKYV